MIQEEMNRKY